MTEPLQDRRKRTASFSSETAHVAAAADGAALGNQLPAISGLAVRRTTGAAATGVIRRDFDFVGKGLLYEPINFEADVVEAINRSKNFRADILKAKQAITALATVAVRNAGLMELARIEKFVKTWEGTKVPLDKRKEVVDEVATTTERLAKIAEDYAEKDAAEGKWIKQQEKKEKKEKERQKKAELKAKEDEAALQREAQQKDLAIAQKNASNRSRLSDRGALPAAETAAKERAQAETAEAEKHLRAEHATAQRFSSKAGKEKAARDLATGLAELDKQRTESANRSLDVLANFTTTSAARQLDPADLSWVIETAGVDPGRARSLAEVINASGKDRTVVRGLAGLTGQELTTTAQHCVVLLDKGIAASSVLAGAKAMTKSPEVKAYLSSASAKMIPGYLSLLDIAAPQELKEAVAFDLQPPGTAYTVDIARRLLLGLEPKKPEQKAVYWLTNRKDKPEFAGLVGLYIDPTVDIDTLRSVFKAAEKVYDPAETLDLCQRHKAAMADLATVVADGQPGCPSYTDLVMATRKRPDFTKAHQLAALRAVALLAANSAKVTVTIAKQPVDFGRGPENQYRQQNAAMDAKTGFVRMAFTDLPGYYEIHTHWGQTAVDGRIYSMHVEYGGTNGIEIHTDQVFRPLIDKVVELHKANYTEPDGGEFYA